MTETQRTLSAELVQRLAAVDIGTNSVRLVIAEPLRSGNYRILDEERESTRLGRSLQQTGRLSEDSIVATLAALRRFKQIAEGYNVSQIRTIATCAVREAENGKEFCSRAKKEVGLEVKVISPQKEAHLAFYSVQKHFDLASKNIALADIGGGSTEIVLASGSLIEAIYPTDLGAVRISEMYGADGPLVGDDFDCMVKDINRRLRKSIGDPLFVPHLLIGSGGTFTSLATMIMARKNQAGLPIRGYQVSRAELSHLLHDLRKLPCKDRRNTPGLNPDRADIIVAGLAIINGIMRRMKVNSLQVHNRGVRDGLMLSMVERLGGGAQLAPVDRDAAIERLASACGADVAHGRHVAMLAGAIHDQLTSSLNLDPADMPLLQAAARLQDVGYLINYDQHHKHSYHLILNSRLRGFRPQELELIANVARYHRGATPKKKHANFRQLNSADQLRVKRLAAILRIAGGLDRSHSQQVTGVTARNAGGKTQLFAHAEFYPEVDIWGARRRTAQFEATFKTTLSVSWSRTGSGVESPPESATA